MKEGPNRCALVRMEGIQACGRAGLQERAALDCRALGRLKYCHEASDCVDR